jgi:hypothetical protein
MPAKFKRHHQAYVLVVQRLDDTAEVVVDGDVHVVDLQLGWPTTELEAMALAGNLRKLLDRVPIDSPVYAQALAAVTEVAKAFPAAMHKIGQYRHSRES